MLRGISPLQGANLRLRKFTVRKNRTVFIHAAQRTGAWMALLLTAAFRGKCAAPPEVLHRTKFLCGCQKATAVDCPDMGIVRKKPPCGGCSQGNGGGLSANGKEKVFIEKKLIYRDGKAA